MDTKFPNSKVIFSKKAYLGIVAETYERIGTETGGIFLGKFHQGICYVLETVDPGPNSVFAPAYFEYDTPYVNHLANKIERFYKSGLELVGLWHRHPGNFSTFSSTDRITNREFASKSEHGAISALVNLVPDFRLTIYQVNLPLQYMQLEYQVDDDLIPEQFREMKSFADYLPAQNPRFSSTSSSSPNFSKQQLVTHQPNRKLKRSGCCLLLGIRPIKLRKKDRQVPLIRNKVEPMESTVPPQDMSTEPIKDSRTEHLLDLVDNELNYLESQIDYDYSLKISDNELIVTMDYIQKMDYYPNNLQFVFGIGELGGYAIIEKRKYRYSPNFIQRHIDQLIINFYNRNLANNDSQTETRGQEFLL